MEGSSQYRSPSQDSTGSRLMLFVGGVAVGYVVATLLAPKSGREVRSSLSDYAKNTTGTVSGAVRNAVGAARAATRTVTRRMADAMDQSKEKARYAVEEAAAKVAVASKSAEEMASDRAQGYQ